LIASGSTDLENFAVNDAQEDHGGPVNPEAKNPASRSLRSLDGSKGLDFVCTHCRCAFALTHDIHQNE
jgi:hypothetical protein